jgi:hypothetical protein
VFIDIFKILLFFLITYSKILINLNLSMISSHAGLPGMKGDNGYPGSPGTPGFEGMITAVVMSLTMSCIGILSI